MTIEFIIPGHVVPKQRPRGVPLMRDGRPILKDGRPIITTYTAKETKVFEASVAMLARAAMSGRSPLGGDVAVTVALHGQGRRGDLDNKFKSITDAMNGIVYVDDRQIRRLVVEAFDGGDERAVVRVGPHGAASAAEGA